MSPRRPGLIANHSKAGAAEIVTQLVDAFAAKGVACELEKDTAQLLGKESASTVADLARTCDLLVVLGGDGTILQVLHQLGDDLPAILGINLGTLGFLTCMSAANWQEAVHAIVEGSFHLSRRTLLDVEVRRGAETVHRHIALNDAVISRGERSHLIRLNVSVDHARLSEYNADGLIVATPTGSTAYSISAGGPVLTPDSGAFVITPICPHVLTMRPVLVSDRSLVGIVPSPGQPDIFLNLDGQRLLRLGPDESIRITKAPQTLALAMLPEMSFFEVLRQKLKWSGTAV
jgi:NAD+ kinase